MTTPHPDLLSAARLLVAAVYYELPGVDSPGDKGELYWTNAIASRYGLFRSQCLAKRTGAAELPARIQAQARVLLDFLGLGSLHPLRRTCVLSTIENGLALMLNAIVPVHVELMQYQMLLTRAIEQMEDSDREGYDADAELPCVCESTPGGDVDLRLYHFVNQQ